MKIVIASIFTSLCLAQTVDCTARVANRTYSAKLDTATHTMEVITDNGYRQSGSVNLYHSPSAQSDTYFLSTGFVRGIELELELGGAHRVALCLSNTECYLCVN